MNIASWNFLYMYVKIIHQKLANAQNIYFLVSLKTKKADLLFLGFESEQAYQPTEK